MSESTPSDNFASTIDNDDNNRSILENQEYDFDEKIKILTIRNAIKKRDTNRVKNLISVDQDFYTDLIRSTPLIYFAIQKSTSEIVNYLLELSSDATIITSLMNQNALSVAITNGDIDMVRTLLKFGWDIHSNINNVADMAEAFDFEQLIPIFEMIDPSRISGDDYYNIIYDMVDNSESVEIFKWIRDHGWPLPSDSLVSRINDIISYMTLYPISMIEMFKIIFGNDPSGHRWWRDNYDGLDLVTIAEQARNDEDPDAQNEARQSIEILIDRVQNLEEQGVIEQLVIDYPEYEVLERSFAP